MVRWDDPQHLIVNSLASLVFTAAVLWSLSSAARPHRQGWRAKAVLLLTLGVGVYVDGFYIPLGPLGALAAAGLAARRRSCGRTGTGSPVGRQGHEPARGPSASAGGG